MNNEQAIICVPLWVDIPTLKESVAPYGASSSSNVRSLFLFRLARARANHHVACQKLGDRDEGREGGRQRERETKRENKQRDRASMQG